MAPWDEDEERIWLLDMWGLISALLDRYPTMLGGLPDQLWHDARFTEWLSARRGQLQQQRTGLTPEEIATLVAAAATGAHRRRDSRRGTNEPERSLQAAEDSQDAAIFLTAALSGLRRSELLALRWEDVDFEQSAIRLYEGFSANKLGKTKSRKSRVVPMVDRIAEALLQLKGRDGYTSKHDLVFVGRDGAHLDGSALRRRYLATVEAAGLRRLRFHDLRHTFGSLSINVASIVQVQAWMGHANITTTMRYLHHKSRADDALLLARAFRSDTAP